MLFRRVATNKPGLTSFCETLGSTFLHPISLISENEATRQIKWSHGLQVFIFSLLFFILFSYFGKLSYRTDKMVPGLTSKNWLATPLLLFSIVSPQVTKFLSLQRELSAFRTWQHISCQIRKWCLVFMKHKLTVKHSLTTKLSFVKLTNNTRAGTGVFS